MQDFSFPGDGPASVMREYECPWVLGCDHTEWSYVVPECPTHRQYMIPVEEGSR
jgi:hypothetical protein